MAKKKGRKTENENHLLDVKAMLFCQTTYGSWVEQYSIIRMFDRFVQRSFPADKSIHRLFAVSKRIGRYPSAIEIHDLKMVMSWQGRKVLSNLPTEVLAQNLMIRSRLFFLPHAGAYDVSGLGGCSGIERTNLPPFRLRRYSNGDN